MTPEYKMRFSGKVALVTASSRGIGFAVAQKLAGEGAAVCICARDEKRLAEALEALDPIAKGRLLQVPGDLASRDFLVELVTRTEKELGTVDVLIANSGGPPAGEAMKFGEAEWQSAFDHNLMSVIRLCQLVVPGMRKKRFGRLIALTSTVAKEPAPKMVLSNVTRAGVVAFMKTLAHELGPDGVTANSILTGGVETERFESLVQKQIANSGETYEAAMARIGKTIPAGFIAKPADMAELVAFMASPEAGYLNGVAIPFDGGALKSAF